MTEYIELKVTHRVTAVRLVNMLTFYFHGVGFKEKISRNRSLEIVESLLRTEGDLWSDQEVFKNINDSELEEFKVWAESVARKHFPKLFGSENSSISFLHSLTGDDL